jgi:hypothetical protein
MLDVQPVDDRVGLDTNRNQVSKCWGPVGLSIPVMLVTV